MLKLHLQLFIFHKKKKIVLFEEEKEQAVQVLKEHDEELKKTRQENEKIIHDELKKTRRNRFKNRRMQIEEIDNAKVGIGCETCGKFEDTFC
jgi:hypothetical protein